MLGEEAVGGTVEEERDDDGVCWASVVVGRRGDDKVSVAAAVVESLDGRRRRIMIESTRPSSTDDDIPVQPFSSHSGPGFTLDSDDDWIASVGIRSFRRIGSGRCNGGSVLCSSFSSKLICLSRKTVDLRFELES